jgi:hypothetical protein
MSSEKTEKRFYGTREFEEKKSSTEGSMKIVHDAAVEDDVDFGSEKSLPPPPKLTDEEEKRLYRKVDLRCVHINSTALKSNPIFGIQADANP